MFKRSSRLAVAVAVLLCTPVAGQGNKDRALELFNAAGRESDPQRQVALFRQSVQLFETFEGSVSLADAILRAKGDVNEARRLCNRAFGTLVNLEAPEASRMQAIALVCLARTYRATNQRATATSLLKKSLDLQRTEFAEQELREVMNTGFKSAEEIAGELGANSARAMERDGITRGAIIREASTDLYVKFDFDQATLTAEGTRQIEELARALDIVGDKGVGRRQYKVVGHTDSRGTDEYNLDLSRRRARTVADLLAVRYRVPASQLVVEGLGERKLLFSGNAESDHAGNRRVEVQEVLP